MSANNSVKRIAGAMTGGCTHTPSAEDNIKITIELTQDEAWALVSAVRPMSISGKQGMDVAWVQQRVYAKLRERLDSGMH